jgi:PKD repeat protein
MYLKRAKMLALVVIVPAICFAGTTAWAITNSVPPGDNFNLSHWKLQLPTANSNLTCTAGSVDEVLPAYLEAGFTNEYFYTGSGGEMVFWAPDNGATTSGSSNPRSELREYINPTTSTANWIPYGTHVLDAQCKVWQVSRAPGDTGKVIIGQIHAYSSAALPTVKIYYSNNGTLSNSGTLYATIKTNSTDDLSDFKFTNYGSSGLSNLITYQIKVVNGLITIAMNNKTNSYNIFQSDPNYTNETQYFKAGDYNQEPMCPNPTNEGVRVAFYAVNLFHAPSITNQPAGQIVTVGSNVTFTVGAAGNPPLRYFWKFGTNNIGSNSATLSVPNVQLTNAGSYSVIITDYVGTVNSVVTSSVAQLTVLSAGFAATPTSGVAPLSVTFTNISVGQTGVSRWDFGNGTLSTNALSFVRTYAAAGTYTVSLTVTNTGVTSSKTNTAYITVSSSPPTANFSATPTNGVAPLGVTFTNTSVGQTGASHWDLGDGTLDTNALSFTHVYPVGTYTVSLTVTNAGGSSTKSNTAYIGVLPPPPTANFSANPTSGLVGLIVSFNDTSTGAPTSWRWNFGDTGTSTAQSPSHTYLTPGVFKVSLTASNSGGASTLISNSLVSVITVQQSWSNSYGVAADSSDADGDGVSNTNEFLTGFNPTNAAAFSHIISVVTSGNDMIISYLGANGDTTYAGGPSSRTNVLEYSSGTTDGSYTNNFLDAGISQVLSNGTGGGVVTNMVDSGGATNLPSRYYRVRLLVP